MTTSRRWIRTGGLRTTHGHIGRRRALVVSSLGAFALAAVVGSSSATMASAGTPTVQVETNATFGTILAAGSGLALYTLSTDHNGQSTCHASCAAVWPPLNVPAGTTPTGGPGVSGTVASSEQSNGTFQVTYNGSPVYTFVGDSAPGQVTGNNVSDFFVVTVAAATPTTTAPVSTPSGTAAPASPTGTPAPATTSGPGPSTAPAAGSTPDTASASGALAFTGTGPGLAWLFLLGAVLALFGAFITFRPARRTRDTDALDSSV